MKIMFLTDRGFRDAFFGDIVPLRGPPFSFQVKIFGKSVI